MSYFKDIRGGNMKWWALYVLTGFATGYFWPVVYDFFMGVL